MPKRPRPQLHIVETIKAGPRGRLIPRGMDGRTRRAREVAELYAIICRDLGGEEKMTFVQRSLAQSVSYFTAMLNAMVVQYLNDGTEIDLNAFVRAQNAQRRLLVLLGLDTAVMPDAAPPSLEAYLATVQAEKEQNKNDGDDDDADALGWDDLEEMIDDEKDDA